MPPDNKCIVVVYKFSFAAVLQCDRFCTAPCQLHHATVLGRVRSAYCTARHKIAHIDIATIYSVVRQLLFHSPVHVFVVTHANSVLIAVLWLKKHFKSDVEVSIAAVLKVWKHFGLLYVTLCTKRLQRFKGHYPWRNGARKILCQKR